MDPDKVLDNIRSVIQRYVNGDLETYEEQATAFGYALDDFISLDDWLSSGGFKPKAWDN